MTRFHRRGQRGAATLEMAVLAPALILLLGLVAFAGRFAQASTAVERAATTAARDASLQRTPAAAAATASGSVTTLLSEQNLHCQGTPAVSVDTSGFTSSGGALGVVRVTVMCTVDISGMGFPGLPGSSTVTGSGTSPVDQFRSTP